MLSILGLQNFDFKNIITKLPNETCYYLKEPNVAFIKNVVNN